MKFRKHGDDTLGISLIQDEGRVEIDGDSADADVFADF